MSKKSLHRFVSFISALVLFVVFAGYAQSQSAGPATTQTKPAAPAATPAAPPPAQAKLAAPAKPVAVSPPATTPPPAAKPAAASPPATTTSGFGSSGPALGLEQTDLVVSSGAVGLSVHRALGGEGVSLLGARWRLDWESRIARSGTSYVVTEGAQQIEFAAVGGAYLGPPGERIVPGPASGTLVRQRGDLTRDGFDAKGRLAWRDFGNGNRVTLSYDASGRLTRIDGPRGIFLAFTLDTAGRMVRIASSTGAAATYSYSGNDLVAVETPTAPPIAPAGTEVMRQQGRGNGTQVPERCTCRSQAAHRSWQHEVSASLLRR